MEEKDIEYSIKPIGNTKLGKLSKKMEEADIDFLGFVVKPFTIPQIGSSLYISNGWGSVVCDEIREAIKTIYKVFKQDEYNKIVRRKYKVVDINYWFTADNEGYVEIIIK